MTNCLAEQSSPYLLQHADNPVDWHAWSEAALRLAQKQNKPILLSIGYSACHWCHVMAHESFEDEETAALMNELYINIKVDREERPDIDKIYQLAHTALTQRSGGWPLTMFLAPDQTPFFGGTYFPKEKRYGMPAFKEILQHIANYYADRPDEIEKQNQSLLRFFNAIENNPQTSPTSSTHVLEKAADDLLEHFDATHGGFGGAPKFPQASNIELALRFGLNKISDEQQQGLQHIANFSLKKMAAGGLYDQLGGGFYRYSVDAQWAIPHFEKMLYDNAILLSLYSEAWQLQHEPLFEKTISQTIHWLATEMRDTNGGFYSALDADSEGEEGKFYVWKTSEIETLLDKQAYELFIKMRGLDKAANFEGAWHLYQSQTLEHAAAELKLPLDTATTLADETQKILFAHRAQRIRPGRDDKILTAWNALLIKGLSIAGITFERKDWIDMAQNAFQFIQNNCWQDNHLLAVHCQEQSQFPAYLDDHAYLLDASLHLLQANWSKTTLDFAETLANILIERFQDKEHGHFYFTANDHENLIHRPVTYADESAPSGAMTASRALHQLGHLLSNVHCLNAAELSLKTASSALEHSSLAHGTALIATLEAQNPPTHIILRGTTTSRKKWQQYARSQCNPWAMIISIAVDETGLPETLANKTAQSDCTAYICHGAHCAESINDFEQFAQALKTIH